jgi:argininosuccinate lyase
MATKLWEKANKKTPEWVTEFTAGNDRQFDLQLAEFDVIGSIAHAAMLAKTGLISKDEHKQLKEELERILKNIEKGNFRIDKGVEDVHSQVELLLTKKLGNIGKKIHTARSRNDQVLLDIKMFIRFQLHYIALDVKELFDLLLKLSKKHKDVLLPGYTHLQAAMPSSFGLWFGAYAESLCDDMELLVAAYHVANKNPLGSGAGYGSSLPIDRNVTTKELNFESMNYNVVYAQMTRGKTEKITAMAMASIAATLSKMAMDVCLYNSENFGFITFPEELTTGSSIMPHKKNPDVFELIRAKCNRIQSLPNELTLLINNLPSGYHRDLQLTKEILFPAFNELHACLNAAVKMLSEAQLKKDILKDEKYKYIFSVEAVNDMVKQGIPFRDAYKKVGSDIANNAMIFTGEINHTHQGSIGNLMHEEIRKEFNRLFSQVD